MTADRQGENAPGNWQRLSPLSVFFFLIKFAVDGLRQGLLNALPAFAALAIFADNRLFWISLLGTALVAGMLVFSFLYYWNFRFQAGEAELLIRRGVVNKERLHLRYARVQNVNIGVPFYFRPFKLVNCIIESAGSKSTEVDLPGVGRVFATELKDRVFAAGTADAAGTAGAAEPGEADGEAPPGEALDPSAPLLRLSNWEAAKHGLTSYLALVVLAGLAPFLEPISSSFFRDVGPRVVDAVEPLVGSQILAGILVLVTTALLFFALMTGGSMLVSLVRFYNFELHQSDDRLVKVAGLLERKTTTLTKQKVQSVSLEQNLMARLLDRFSLQFRQVGMRDFMGTDSGLRVPLLRPEQVPGCVSLAFDAVPEPSFSGIHPSYVGRVFFFFWFLPLAGLLVVPVVLVSHWFLLLFAMLAPVFLLLKLRYRRYGFWFDETYGAIREGWFGQNVVVFPLAKVQLLRVRQSRGQRRRRVANLRVQLGSGNVAIPYVPMARLDPFVNRALYETESSTKGWM